MSVMDLSKMGNANVGSGLTKYQLIHHPYVGVSVH